MSDIRKTFNFRAGVQVDDDVFIVRGEQVGIGTTVPGEALDVRGNAKVVGILTATNVNFSAGISTFGDVKIGAGITVNASSGIITANKFVGNGSLLTNLPTSPWTQYSQLYNGLTVTSIAKNLGHVGVGTTTASTNFQVGSNPYDGVSAGVGIQSTGNIRASGVVTATTFVGDLVGGVSNVTTGLTTFTDDVQFQGTRSGITSALWNRSDDRLEFFDNVKATFGDNADLSIYHSLNGNTDSYIDSSARNLYIRLNAGLGTANGGNIALQAQADEHGLLVEDNGPVRAYFNGEERLATSGFGITVTGITSTNNLHVSSGIATIGNVNIAGGNVTGLVNVTNSGISSTQDLNVVGISTLRGDVNFIGAGGTNALWDQSQAHLIFDDEAKVAFVGPSNNPALELSHTNALRNQDDSNGDNIVNGRTSFIEEKGPGGLIFKSNGADGAGAFQFFDSGWRPILKLHSGTSSRVVLFHGASSRLTTSGAGITITGIIEADRIDGNVNAGIVTASTSVNVGTAATINSTGYRGNLVGDVTGNVTGNVTGTSGGLTGTPDITVDEITAGNSTVTRLGINTTTVQKPLQIFATVDDVIRVNTNKSGANISFVDDSGSQEPFIGGLGNNLAFGTNNSGEKVRITGIGSIGIGVTLPSNKLHVVGTSTVTDTAFFGGQVKIVGNVVTLGSLTADSLSVPAINSLVIGSNANVHATTGVSTFRDVNVSGAATVSGHVSVGTTFTDNPLSINNVPRLRFEVTPSGATGICTNAAGIPTDIQLLVNKNALMRRAIGVGDTTALKSLVDFSSVGAGFTSDNAIAYMLPPKNDQTGINAFSRIGGGSTQPGALVYNVTTNKLQCWDPTGNSNNGIWRDLW